MPPADSAQPPAQPTRPTSSGARSPQTRPVGMIGMVLLLASLTMLFAASIAGYVVMRLFGATAPEAGSVDIPTLLWASTAVMLLSSLSIHVALTLVRQGSRRHVAALVVTLILALAFIALQVPALHALLSQHGEYVQQRIGLYGLAFVLVLLHAAHVLGGLIPLAIITLKATRGTYTPEAHAPVRYVTMYWHFLDIIWFIMFAVFVATA